MEMTLVTQPESMQELVVVEYSPLERTVLTYGDKVVWVVINAELYPHWLSISENPHLDHLKLMK